MEQEDSLTCEKGWGDEVALDYLLGVFGGLGRSASGD